MQLLTVNDLSRILGRSPNTIRADVHRNPGALPPRLNLPGTRLLRWRPVDVEQWISHLKTSQKRGRK
jgi:predicted DNA-binding transcriptional regulator AlpA